MLISGHHSHQISSKWFMVIVVISGYCGYQWLLHVFSGYCVVITCYQWLLRGYQWLLHVISGYCVVISGYRMLSVVIVWLSVVITCYQITSGWFYGYRMLSVVIAWYRGYHMLSEWFYGYCGYRMVIRLVQSGFMVIAVISGFGLSVKCFY